MLKRFFISLMTIFSIFVIASSSQAMVVQNKSDTAFNITSADYAELYCSGGVSVCPDKQKHCISISGCQDGCITLSTVNGCCIQPLKVAANEKIVIKGKKGNYTVTRYPLNGGKEKIKFACCSGGCAVQ